MSSAQGGQWASGNRYWQIFEAFRVVRGWGGSAGLKNVRPRLCYEGELLSLLGRKKSVRLFVPNSLFCVPLLKNCSMDRG